MELRHRLGVRGVIRDVVELERIGDEVVELELGPGLGQEPRLPGGEQPASVHHLQERVHRVLPVLVGALLDLAQHVGRARVEVPDQLHGLGAHAADAIDHAVEPVLRGEHVLPAGEGRVGEVDPLDVRRDRDPREREARGGDIDMADHPVIDQALVTRRHERARRITDDHGDADAAVVEPLLVPGRAARRGRRRP